MTIDARKALAWWPPEHPPRVHLDAVDGGNDHDGGFDGRECFEGRADEVGRAGGVEDVEVLAVVIGVEDVGIDGEVVFVFFLVEVGDGGAVVHAAQPIDRVGLEEQGIGQAGLARGAVPHECNVPHVFHQVLDGHDVNSKREVYARCAGPCAVTCAALYLCQASSVLHTMPGR